MLMFNAPYKNWWRQSWHPDEQDLFLCLEGELGTKPAARIRKHLERCWPCRMKHEELKHSISSIMKCRSALLASAPGFPAHAEQRFLAKLGRQAAAEGKKDAQLTLLLKGLSEKTTPRRLPLAFACGVAVFLGILLWLRLGSVPIVSAREMLERTKRAEDQRVSRMANPVVYQKLRVRRTSTTPKHEHVLVWETWNDRRNRRFRQEVEEVRSQGSGPARPTQAAPSDRLAGAVILDELTQVFRTNHMDQRRPLSAAGFESWRRSIQPASEQVREATLADGGRALILTTTVTEALRENAIANAEWVVRAADWHPIQQRLKVQGKQELWEYELTETAFDVVALNSLDASFFAAVTPTPVKPPLPALSKAQPVLPPETEWIATEIEAYFALHGAKACLGEELEVVRTASIQVQVKGLVETPERKQELLLALQALPQVSSSIQTVAEALIASASQSPPTGASRSGAERPDELPSREEVRSQRLPIQDQLERHFSQLDQTVQPSGRKAPGGVARRIAELSDQSISISRSLLLEAWALRRLADRYPQERIRELRPRARWLLETMLREHLEAQGALASQLRSLLFPVLNAIAGQTAVSSLEETDLLKPGPEDSSWRAISLLLFGRCERVAALARDLFASQGLSDAAGDEAVRDLLSLFSGWEAVSNRLESEISRAFPGNPNRVSAKH